VGGDGREVAEDGFSPRLRALTTHLWNPSDSLLVTTRSETPPDYREIESYLLVPSPSAAQFLVPLNAGRSTAAATLLAYNRLRRRRTQLRRTVVAGGVRAGLLPVRRHDRLRILVHRDLADADLIAASPTHWLADMLHVDQVLAAVGVPAATPNSKPTMQLFANDGTPIAYAKFSWNESTRVQVRNETQMAAELGPLLHQMVVPKVLHAAQWRGFDVGVTAPMSHDAVAWGRNAAPPPLTLIDEISRARGPHDYQLAASPQLQRLTERIEAGAAPETGGAPESELRVALRAANLRVTQRWGDCLLRHGPWHGDWVPWNLARDSGKTIAWDWEHSRDDMPAGLDALHWHFQTSFIRDRKPLAVALQQMRVGGGPGVAELQGDQSVVEPCAALYTLELSVRYMEMQQAGAGWHPRFHPDILDVLGALGS
jgi:hypothetical protein